MTRDFFKNNRAKLSAQLQGGVVVLTAYAEMQRGNDMSFAFEQEANFWWLTGIEAPDWWCIIDTARQRTWLVAPDVSESQQIFDGSLAAEAAKETSGADEVLPASEAQALLRQLAKKHSIAYGLGDMPYQDQLSFTINPAQKKIHTLLKRTFSSVQDCRKELAGLRAIKQPEEIEAIKEAIKLTSEAFEKVKARLQNFHYEYEIEAEFTYEFRRGGAKGHAYDPIVAAGGNACTLHYVSNDARLKKRQLLLLDIGARHKGYAADITRTYAFGEPTKRQEAVHAAVQRAHHEICGLLKAGLPVEQYLKDVDMIMKRELEALGLIGGVGDDAAYRTYFPHAISHGLGVDVHDSLGAPRIFKPGMVLTVEPGIYIPSESIGVRIEDDILITENGAVNLSAKLSTDL